MFCIHLYTAEFCCIAALVLVSVVLLFSVTRLSSIDPIRVSPFRQDYFCWLPIPTKIAEGVAGHPSFYR